MRNKKFLAALLVVAGLVVVCAGTALGGEKPKLWSKLCASCHDGSTAPGPEDFRETYKTADEFTAAVKAKGAQCMNIVKNDERVIRRIAVEIGIPDRKK